MTLGSTATAVSAILASTLSLGAIAADASGIGATAAGTSEVGATGAGDVGNLGEGGRGFRGLSDRGRVVGAQRDRDGDDADDNGHAAGNNDLSR
jgi:hypothetical protein